ncbi:ribonuclease H-like domain-containing protein [Tanacetum coccineum]|uniref:Ribonuclease H-like domain-containing protein n=1 Tax=Tanacetum coccineum TaxID=301880 RepID=A0ABQ4WK38_9ASTR
MAILKIILLNSIKMTDAKEMWNVIKSRFGENDESKKMQKYILKQQFKGFTVSNTDGIHKGYERFQSLLMLIGQLIQKMMKIMLSWLANKARIRTQREQLSDASVEIKAYTQGLKKVEAQLVAHQQGTGLHAPIIEEYESDSDDGAHDQGIKLTLADFQDFNGGPVALDGGCVCKGYIMVKEIKPGIKREYSNARTPQQNGVAERKNRTLIEAARTMLADSFLPNTFWAEAVSTACYVLNRVLVTKPHNKTPYELLTGKTPIISYIRPFGCHVTILNTIDHLGKFAGKSDEGFLVGYSLQSKAFRVYNLVTKRVEENLHINFLENKPNVAGKGPNWLFDLDYLTDSMNYHSVSSENQANIHAGQQESNQNAGTKDKIDAGDSEKEDESAQDCFEVPFWHSYSSTNTSASKSDNKRGGPREEEQVFLDDLARLQRQEKEANEEAEALRKNLEQETENLVTQAGAAKSSSTNIFSTVSTTAKASGTNFVNTVSIPVSTASANEGLSLSETTNSQKDDNEIPPLEDIHEDTTDGIFTHSSYDDEGAEADFTNLETIVNLCSKAKETDNAQSEGRTREMVDEDKEIDEDRLSTEDAVSTDKEKVSTDFEKVSTDFEKVSTDKPKVSTDGSKVSTDEQIEGADDQVEGTEEIFASTEEQRPGTEEKVVSTDGQIEGTKDQTKEEIATPASQSSTQTPTSMIFGDDETIATLLFNMSKAKAVSKEKEKRVELKDVMKLLDLCPYFQDHFEH